MLLPDLGCEQVHHRLLLSWKSVQNKQDKDVHHLVVRSSADSLDGLKEAKEEGRGGWEWREEGEGRRYMDGTGQGERYT